MTDNPLNDIREHSKSISNGDPPILPSVDKLIPATVEEQDKLKQISLEQVAAESIQPRARGETETTGLSYLFALRAGGTVSPWWVPKRDTDLRAFVIASDHLKGAIYNFITRMAAIPFRIIPREKTIARHVRDAKEWQHRLEFTPELFGGYRKLIQKILADYLETDNGLFMEIVAPGAKDTPIIGEVTTVNHLDSTRIIRTNNPEFPVIYEAPRGGRFKLHRSRVAFASQLPSADEEMNGVGLCAVSRCLDAAQNLLDMDIFRQEKIGSRPGRTVIVASGGLSPKVVGSAIEQATLTADARGLTRYSMTPIVGSRDLPEGALSIVDLASVPDNFDFNEGTSIGMAIIALALGVDVRDIFPATAAGATRADALIQHVKQRGKGPADVISTLEHIFNNFVLPPHLFILYDFQDDAQDRQQAEIQQKRSLTRASDLENAVTTIRVERLKMVEKGEISEDDFVEMELQDGRLPNGLPVTTLFASRDPAMISMLILPGVQNPLDVNANDPDIIIPLIDKQESNVLVLLGTANSRDQRKAREALAALKALKLEYEFSDAEVEEIERITMGASDEPDALTIPDDEENLAAAELDAGRDLSDEKALIVGNKMTKRFRRRLSRKVHAARSSPNVNVLELIKDIISSIPDSPPVSMNFDMGDGFGELIAVSVQEVLKNMPQPSPPVVEVNPNIYIPEQPTQEIIVELQDSEKSITLELPPKFVDQLEMLVKQQSDPVINITIPDQPAPVINNTIQIPDGAVQLTLPEQEVIDIRRDA